jgi:hypothetical protein
VQYTKPRRDEKGEAPIEPNHTEFIFVDDGTERQYGREIAFRARLERAISGDFFGARPTANSIAFPTLAPRRSSHVEPSMHEDIFNSSFDILGEPVPVVLLVVEGGPNTVRTGINVHFVFFSSNNQWIFISSSRSSRSK